MDAAPLPIREARLGELGHRCDIEVLADDAFASIGLHFVLDSPLPDTDSLVEPLRRGRLLVAAGSDDRAVGFVRIDLLDGVPHVEQVAVHPDHAGRGIGAALIRAAEAWALARGADRLTLTTFRDVPWNGPYYERLGWLVLPDDEAGPELAAARRRERQLGLDQAPRQCMVRFVDGR